MWIVDGCSEWRVSGKKKVKRIQAEKTEDDEDVENQGRATWEAVRGMEMNEFDKKRVREYEREVERQRKRDEN